MINENILAQEYLNGENINKKILYRICFILSKWFKEHPDGNEKEEEISLCIRRNIFKWAGANHIKIDFYLNACITKALDDPKRLTSDNPIRISKEDVGAIVERFDTHNVRLLALAMLCYAKQFADSNKQFSISLLALSDWTKIHSSAISGRHIKELVDFGYISKVNENLKEALSWNNTCKNKINKYQIKVPISNVGEYTLEGNDILGLYKQIFK